MGRGLWDKGPFTAQSPPRFLGNQDTDLRVLAPSSCPGSKTLGPAPTALLSVGFSVMLQLGGQDYFSLVETVCECVAVSLFRNDLTDRSSATE